MMSNDVQKLHDAVLMLGDAALEIATALSAFTKGEGGSGAFKRPGDPKPAPDEKPGPRRVSLSAVARKSIKAGTEVVVFGLVKKMRERYLRDDSGNKMRFLTLAWPEGEGGVLKYCEVVVPTKASSPALTVGAEVTVTGRLRLDDALRLWADKVCVEKIAPPKEKKPPQGVSYITGEPISKLRAEKRAMARGGAERAGYDYEHWCRMVRRIRVHKFNLRAGGLGDLVGVSAEAVASWEAGVCFAKSSTRERLERISHALAGTTADSWKQPE
jgi:hypothetical protein